MNKTQLKFDAMVRIVTNEAEEAYECSNLYLKEGFMVSVDINSTRLYKEGGWWVEERSNNEGEVIGFHFNGITEEEFLLV